ncbi:MAG: SPOR domain-containing protein [Polaromonas sp.]|uniref:SPOR domain-containing protein n=1 Tax=Polaromonas sp. TaxID=1869339 RepID=UPI003267DCE7
MPFFNFRRGGSNAASTAGPAAQPESVEVIRKRAKHRLIGSAVLVLAGVVGFPLLFDTQPRPIPVDIPIEIPGKASVKPLVVPASPNTPVAASAPKATDKPAEKVAADASLAPKEEILATKPAPALAAPAPPAIKNEAKPEAKPETKPEVKPPVKPESKPAAKPPVSDDATRAAALLNGGAVAPAAKPATAAAEAEGRFVVQVGAFADVAKAREARLKVEKAGMKTYTQVAETKDGKRIRVRVGPFASKAEADKAATKIKALDLPAAILTL